MIDSLIEKSLGYCPHSGDLFWLESRGSMKRGSVAGNVKTNVCYGKQYKEVRVGGKTLLAHRVAWFIHNGKWPKNTIDHINGDGTDNRICNLRDVEMGENNKNKSKPKNNTSGIIGVRWNKKDKRWIAYIYVESKRLHLGSFTDKDSAIQARKNAQDKYNFHANHGNIEQEADK